MKMANVFENELYEKNQHLMVCKKETGVKWKCVKSDTTLKCIPLKVSLMLEEH